MGNAGVSGLNCIESAALNQFHHPAYGPLILNPKTPNIGLIQRRIPLDDPQRRQFVISRLNHRKQLNHPSLVRLIDFKLEEQSYSYKLVMLYEYLQQTLEQRAKAIFSYPEQPEFEEEELISLISQVQSALHFLNSHDIQHSNISAKSIVRSPQGVYKITDLFSITNLTSYDLALKGNSEQILSESLIENIRFKAISPIYKLEDDLFALGLLVLSLAAKCSFQIFYDYAKLSIKNKVVENKLREIAKTYSSKLVRKVKELLVSGMEIQLNLSGSTNYESIHSNPSDASLSTQKLH